MKVYGEKGYEFLTNYNKEGKRLQLIDKTKLVVGIDIYPNDVIQPFIKGGRNSYIVSRTKMHTIHEEEYIYYARPDIKINENLESIEFPNNSEVYKYVPKDAPKINWEDIQEKAFEEVYAWSDKPFYEATLSFPVEKLPNISIKYGVDDTGDYKVLIGEDFEIEAHGSFNSIHGPNITLNETFDEFTGAWNGTIIANNAIYDMSEKLEKILMEEGEKKVVILRKNAVITPLDEKYMPVLSHIILKSSNGSKFKVTVENSGTLTTTKVTE